MKNLGKWIKGIVIVLLAGILLINMWVVGARVIGKQTMPMLVGFSEAVVLSGSMEPTVSPGDVAIYHAQSDYEPGDVVAFLEGESITTHRIILVADGLYYTKGDANNTPDQGSIAKEQILGRMIGHIPGLGQVVLILRTPLGMLILVVITLALLVGDEWISSLRRLFRRFSSKE